MVLSCIQPQGFRSVHVVQILKYFGLFNSSGRAASISAGVAVFGRRKKVLHRVVGMLGSGHEMVRTRMAKPSRVAFTSVNSSNNSLSLFMHKLFYPRVVDKN